MSLPFAAAIWAVVIIFVAFYGMRLGLGGPRFAVALGIASALFAFELFLAVPSVLDACLRIVGERGAVLAPLVPLFAMLIYAVGVTGGWKSALIGAAYVVLPSLFVASSAGKPPGTFGDYAGVAIIWLPIEFRWMYPLFPFPSQLTHTLAILLALSTGIAAFILLRRLDGIGYAVSLNRGDLLIVLLHFSLFAIIAIAIGTKIGFLTFDPSGARLHPIPIALSVLGILLFTAWPEEFLFRGVMQNLFSRSFNNQWAGLALASVIFGLSHIFHAPFPNWKYVFLATIAGLFYGRTWMKTGSIFPAALVHAMVDILWHLLFR
jgi:membrane protease YdiL (CAAX protease family)